MGEGEAGSDTSSDELSVGKEKEGTCDVVGEGSMRVTVLHLVLNAFFRLLLPSNTC